MSFKVLNFSVWKVSNEEPLQIVTYNLFFMTKVLKFSNKEVKKAIENKLIDENYGSVELKDV